MNENEARDFRKKWTWIAMGILALVAVFIVYFALVLKENGVLYGAVVIIGIGIFWAIMDIWIPVKSGEFASRTKEQMDAYKKYAAMDLVGYGGLIYFALAAGQNTGIYGALVYVAARMMKRRFQEEYEGDSGEDEDEADADVDVDADVNDDDDEEIKA